ICAYFRDFLDTDFKRQAAPKRSVTLKDAARNLTGSAASKYPDLVNEVWRLLRKPIDDNPAFSLAVPRGRYRGRLKTALKELIDKHAQALSEDDLKTIADRGSVTAREQPFLSLVLNGPKTVESRFSRNRCAPFGEVEGGDIILLKEVSGPIRGIGLA